MCRTELPGKLWAVLPTTSPRSNPMAETKTKTLTWIAGSSSLAAILAVGAIAFWPASETDKARADGEAFGASVAALQDATTYGEVDAALVDMRDALADTGDHMTDEVAEQVDQQADALDRAVDGFVGERTSGDELEQ